MAKYKVELIREECTACESCVEECPDFFEMADDGWSHMKNSKRMGSNDELDLDDLGCMMKAAEACPVTIVHVYEGGNKII